VSGHESVLILGAGGHARVVLDILLLQGQRYDVIGLTDPDSARHGERIRGVEIAGDDSVLEELDIGTAGAIVAVGDNGLRRSLGERCVELGIPLVNAIHPRAWVSEDAYFGSGVAIMAGAVVNCGSKIADGVIVNTGASVDHDCTIGAYAHIGPGANLAGWVRVDDEAQIGVGASVIPGIAVGARAVVGAGGTVIRDVPSEAVVVGVPARLMRART